MRFSLDVLRARKGDCLLLHYGTASEPRTILIDGGPSGVFNADLERRIQELRRARRLKDDNPLPLDILMVSHVDDDHIKGILDLTRLLRRQKDKQEPLLVRVGSLWHNSFDDLLGTTPEELEVEAQFGAASTGGTGEVVHGATFDAALVLASIPQGRTLRLDADFLKWRLNQQFGGKLILAARKAVVTLPGGLDVTVIGPLPPELKALQKAHDKWVREQKKRRAKDPGAALAAFVDKSIPNLSSIVMLVGAKGKTMLLTGDARGDKILDGLVFTGLIDKGKKSTLHVDVLKVPHHGSANNVERSFFERVTADHYVFSGNGEHGNPERKTLEMLFAARGTASLALHFTYPLAEIDAERRKDWEKERQKEKRAGRKVRPAWSATKHGLVSFFAKSKLSSGQDLHVVPDHASHGINLLEDIGV